MIKRISMIKDTLLRWWHFFIYKPDSKDLYWEKILSSCFVIVLFFALMFYGNNREKERAIERKTHSRFTIGVTTDYHNNIRSSYTDVDFRYYVGHQKYTGSGSVPWLSNNVKKVKGRYYVQFASNNPINSKILFEYPVPDSILHSPDSGWTYMPGYPNQ
jgi:hypothetical protein